MKKGRILQSTTFLMIIILCAKIIGMLREVVLANYFGTSNVSDAYLIAVSVPNFLFFFIGHSLSTAYLPMFNKIRHEKGEEKAQAYTNTLICCTLVVSTVIVALLLIFPEVIVRVFAAGFDDATVGIASTFVRISAASLYFMTIINVWGSYLQSKGNFIIPASISVPRNIVIMISIFLAATVHISLLGIGLLVAYISEFLLLLPFVLKKGFRPQIRFEYKTPELKETLNLIIPILLGVGVSQINHIVDRSLASTVVSGGISALTYASILNNAVQEILVTGIITILFAKCSSWVAEGKHELVKSKLMQTLNTMIFLLVPASVGIVICAEPIVKCVLCRGEFDDRSLQMTTGALCCYTVGLTFLGVRDMLVKVMYAYKSTKVTTTVSIISILVNVILNFVLSYFMGLNGLALATAIAGIVNCVTLYVLLRRKIGDFGFGKTVVTVVKTLVACGVMAVVILLMQQYVTSTLSDLVELIVCVAVGAAVYFIVSLILRSEPMMGALKGIKGFLKKGDRAAS